MYQNNEKIGSMKLLSFKTQFQNLHYFYHLNQGASILEKLCKKKKKKKTTKEPVLQIRLPWKKISIDYELRATGEI